MIIVKSINAVTFKYRSSYWTTRTKSILPYDANVEKEPFCSSRGCFLVYMSVIHTWSDKITKELFGGRAMLLDIPRGRC